jgi:serine/threonine-protein kinase HipA
VAESGYVPRDRLSLWWLGDPGAPLRVGDLSLVMGGRAVALSEDLPLTSAVFVPKEKGRAVGAVDDARPDQWGERVIRHFEQSPRMSVLEYLLFAALTATARSV